jgi:hypothetical protein
MGWGLEFKDYLNRGRVANLESDKEEAENYIKSLQFDLVALSASSPHEVKDEGGNPFEWIEYVSMRVRNILNELEEQHILLHKINICIENKDEICQD